MTTETRVSQMPATPALVDQRLKALEIAVGLVSDREWTSREKLELAKDYAEEILRWARRPM